MPEITWYANSKFYESKCRSNVSDENLKSELMFLIAKYTADIEDWVQ